MNDSSRASRCMLARARTLARVAIASLLAIALPVFATVTPIDYYRMGETENANLGFAVSTPDSVGGKTLSLTGAPFYSNDLAPAATSATGSTRSMNSFPNNLGIYGSATLLTSATDNVGIELWVKPYATASGNHCILYNGDSSANGFGLYQVGAQYQVKFGGVTTFGAATATANQWTHLALVRSGGTTTLYVNGVESTTSTAVPLTPSGSFGIVASPPNFNTEFFSGLLDEVRAFTFAPGAFSTGDLLLAHRVVTNANDSGAGSLRTAMTSPPAGTVIDINTTGTLTLASMLPFVTATLEIHGPGAASFTIDGANQYRPIFVDAPSSAVLVSGVTFAHGLAKGGNGGGAGFAGGGGLGAGGAMFVNRGDVTLSGVAFVGNTTTGGKGGDHTSGTSSAGGGAGLGGNGGLANGGGGGGGGGFLGNGGIGNGSGGAGGGGLTGNGGSGENTGGGGGALTSGQSGAPVSTGAGADGLGGNGGTGTSAGVSGLENGGGGGGSPANDGVSLFSGGNGGRFGGGGGGAASGTNSGFGGDFSGGGGAKGDAGRGGFGGGGGGSYFRAGGSGGFGGGGGANTSESGNISNAPGGTFGGRGSVNSANGGAGGGGGALGAAVFVRTDAGASLSVFDSQFDAGTLTAGAPGSEAAGCNSFCAAAGGGARGETMFLIGGSTRLDVSAGTRTIAGSIGSSSTAPAALIKTGAGTLQLAGNSIELGTFNVTAGTLQENGTLGATQLSVSSGATIAGSGTVGPLSLSAGATLSPGSNLGKLTAGNTVFTGAGNYNWQLRDSTAAAGVGYDTLTVNGTLDVSAASGFKINLWTLSSVAPDVNGPANFDPNVNAAWTLVHTTGGIVGFNAANFAIVSAPANGTGGFANSAPGAFTLSISGNDLIVQYTSPAQITLQQPAGNNLPNGGSRDFGSLLVGTGTTRTFSIANIGGVALQLTGTPKVSVSGSNASDYIVTSQPASPIAGAPPGLANNGFEFPAQSPAGFTYAPGGTEWTYGATAGVASNGSPWFVTAAPQGTQAAFIQLPDLNGNTSGAFVQRAVTLPVGSVSISFSAARRGGTYFAPDLAISVDGTTIGNATSTSMLDNNWHTYAFTYNCTTAGSHVLRIGSNQLFTEEHSAAIDNLVLTAPPTPATFDVTFTPSASGTRNAMLSIANNDATKNPFTVSLTGNGTQQEIDVEQPAGVPLASGSSRDFDGVALSQSTSLTFLIRNSGTAPLTGIGVSKSGADASMFALTTAPSATVAPGASTTFTVQFTPTTPLAKTATLNISSNDTDENPYVIGLSGTGLAPDIAVEQPAGTAIPDGGAVSFGTAVSMTPIDRVFTIRNTGNIDLNGLGVTINGTDFRLFSVVSAPATSVSAGGSTTFTVRFAPTASGNRIANLHIASNDPDENPYDIALNASSSGPIISLEYPNNGVSAVLPNGGSRDFGNVDVGQNNSLLFAVVNNGDALLSLTGNPHVQISGTNAGDFTVLQQPADYVTPPQRIGVPNFGFELPALGTGNFSYAPSGAQWTFGAQAGIASNGSGWFIDNALEGTQAAFIQTTSGNSVGSELSTTLNFPTTGDYNIRFYAAARQSTFGGTDIDVRMDDVTLSTISSTQQRNSWFADGGLPRSVFYTCTAAGTHVLKFAGTKTNGDFASAIDQVVVTPINPPLFYVRFAPQAPGPRTAIMSIANNDTSNNPFTTVLTGTAPTPDIAVEQPDGVPLPSGGSSDFGTVPGGQSASLTYRIRNTGAGLLQGVALSLSGADASLFTVSAAPSATVAAGASTTFTLSFAPLTLGGKTATLHIASNDADENPYDIVLTGTGAAFATPEIDLEQPAGTALASGGSRDFGMVAVNQTATLTFSIKNTGTAPLTGIDVSKSGTDASSFVIVAAPDTTVGAGNSTTFVVLFAPASTGGKSATLSIASNDADENPYVIGLTGAGTAPDIAVEQPLGSDVGNGGTRSFGTVNSAATADLTFTVRNTGNVNLDSITVKIFGQDAPLFSVLADPASTLAAGASTTFTVRFAPQSSGSKSATLSIASNDPDENPYTIGLTGLVPGADIVLEEPALIDKVQNGGDDFGHVVVGGNLLRTFTIRNDGNLPLSLTGNPIVQISGPNPADFVVTQPAVSSIPAFAIPDAGFESPSLGFGGFTYAPPGTPWNFGARAGIASVGSPWFINAPLEGVQAAYIQTQGDAIGSELSTTFACPGAGDFQIRFTYVRRGSGYPGTDVDVRVDDVTLATVAANAQTDDNWRMFSVPATCTGAGPHVLKFAGTLADNDRATAIDAVRIGPAPIFTVSFAPQASGARIATLSIASNDSGDNPFNLTVLGTGDAGGADLQLSNTNFGNTLFPGNNTAYTIQVRNAGPSSVSSVHIVDHLPATLGNGHWTCTSAPPALCPNASGNGDIDQTTAQPLASGAMLQYSLFAKVANGASGFVVNSASVTSNDASVTEVDTGNNSATDTDSIVGDGIFRNGFENVGSSLLSAPL